MNWLIWWFWTSRRCEHIAGEWQLTDIGRRKIQHCTKCGKCVGLV